MPEVEVNWKKGDVLETPKGQQFMFGHYDRSGFWVHRITKSGAMDRQSLGLYLMREGVKPATFDPAKRGGWPAKVKPSPAQKPPAAPGRRFHRWVGAGFVCTNCGAIKGTGESSGTCPGTGTTGFDLWLYHAGAGWWLSESEIETHATAAQLSSERIGCGNVVAAAILPAGQSLGLFTKRRGG